MSAKHKLNAAHMTGSCLVAIMLGVIFQSALIALGAMVFLLSMDLVGGNIRR